jgi:hypothetical protein
MNAGSSLGVTMAWLLCALTAQAQASGEPSARYARALANELDALGLVAQCNEPSPTSFACAYPARSAIDKQNLTAHAHYDDTTDTVYVYVPLLSIAENSPALPGLLRRAMELNWELLSAKLEWSAQTGELRVSSVLHTDSNFDRRAFRSLVRSLDRVILRHYVELTSLAAVGGGHL